MTVTKKSPRHLERKDKVELLPAAMHSMLYHKSLSIILRSMNTEGAEAPSQKYLTATVFPSVEMFKDV